jgi:phytoene/squalene synthetase
MKLDLVKSDYSSTEEYNEYIWFSGCCRSNVFKGFVAGKTQKYEQLKEAMRLGSAFQKVNFLRLEGR